jgi:hypothetical protein
MLVYASFGVVIFPIGIPLVFCVLVFSQHDKITQRDLTQPLHRDIKPLSMLFRDYSPDMPYTEAGLCMYRILLCALLPLLSRDPALRCAFGLLFALLFAVLVREVSPFTKESNNALAFACMWQLVFTFVTAFILIAEPWHISNRNTYGALLVISTFFVLCLAFHQQKLESARKKLLFDKDGRILLLEKSLDDFRRSSESTLSCVELVLQ